MYVTGSPAAGQRAAPPRLAHLTWAGHLSFGQQGRRVLHDDAFRRAMLRYQSDMLTPYGEVYSEACFDVGNQNSYSFLAQQMLEAMPASVSARQAGPDLLVIAHATADCDPGRSVSGYLTTLLPSEPLCFAISDQGEAAPFSALHTVRGFTAAGWRERALVLIVDQSTLAYAARPSPGPGGALADDVVGLLFDSVPSPAARPLAGVWQRSAIAPGQLGRALAEIIACLPQPGPLAGGTTVLAGPGLAGPELAALLRDWQQAAQDGHEFRVRQVPPGMPCVPAWAGLAGLLAEAPAGRVLVIEYDRALAVLGAALFDPSTRQSSTEATS